MDQWMVNATLKHFLKEVFLLKLMILKSYLPRKTNNYYYVYPPHFLYIYLLLSVIEKNKNTSKSLF